MEREKLISLVTAAQSGDNGALNELFNAFYNDVYYFALKTVKDEELACDITQEAFVEILRTIGNLQEPAAFVKWMKQITYHQCTRYFKKKKDVIVDEDEDGNTLFDAVQEDKTDFIPDEALDQDEFKKTILSMLDDLSEEQRAAVLLFYYDELSVKQIAEIQGVSENTVKSRLNYARKGIKKSVEDYEEKHGIKLHGLTALPLLRWVLGDLSQSTPAASAGLVAEGVSAATGATITVATTASTAATAATAAATATTAVGIGAKIAAIPLAVKVVAGIAAAAIAIGGGTAAVILSNGGEDAPTTQTQVETQLSTHLHDYVEEILQAATCTEDGSAVYTCDCGDTYTAAVPATHTFREWSRQGFREYRSCRNCGYNESRRATLTTEEEILVAYTDEISWLGYFTSVDKLDVLNVFNWCQCTIDPVDTVEYEVFDDERNETLTCRRTVYAVSDLNALTTQVLGRTWDYSALDGHTEDKMYTYYYDAWTQTVIEDFDCRYSGMGLGIGSPNYHGYEQIDETRFAIEYHLDYYGDEVHGNVIEVELINGQYIITANYAAEDVPSDVTGSTTTTTNPTGSATTTTNPAGSTTATTNPTTGSTTTTTSGGHNNVIYTYNFENGLGNWVGSGDSSAVEIIKAAHLPVANKAGGTQALQFTYGIKYDYCVDKTAFVVEPDTDYTLTFDVLSDEPDYRIRAVVSVNSWLAEQVLNVNYYVAADRWQTMSATFNSGSNTNLYLGFQAMLLSNTIYIDNITIAKVSATTGHTHNYVAKTTAATCTADGKKVYTCSCGNSYTEVLTATGHSFGAWSQTKAPTTLEQGAEARTCSGCALKQTRIVDPSASSELFARYAAQARDLCTFPSVSDLSRNDLLNWCYHLGGLTYQAVNHNPQKVGDLDTEYIFRTADLDAATMDCFGRTWDYAFFGDYNATNGTVTICKYKNDNNFNDGELIWAEYSGYDQVDDTQYDIYYGKSYVLRVKRVDNNFVFVHFQAK